jgi:hypothetical protein
MGELTKYLGAVICVNEDTKEDYHAFIFTRENDSQEFELNNEKTGLDLLKGYEAEGYLCNFEEKKVKLYDIYTNSISLAKQAVVLQMSAEINGTSMDVEQLNHSLDKYEAKIK